MQNGHRRLVDTDAGARKIRAKELIERALHGDGLSMVFQPIANLRTGRVAGFESLARFESEPPHPPDAWFEKAAAVGLGVDLELAGVRAALAHLGELPRGAYLSVNLSPEAAVSPRLAEALEGVPPDRIVIEITEHAQVDDYDALDRALGGLRARGMRLAIDDVGAGFASMLHVLKLDPDLIKLDMRLTRGIDTDQRRRALVASLVDFSALIGITIVAEGIETAAEATVLRKLGVGCGQGYYLGRPAPLPATSVAPARRRLVALVAAARGGVGGRSVPRPRRRRLVLRPATAVLTLALLAGPTVAALAANAQPGSLLWPAKLRLEQVRLFLETDPARKVTLHLEFANRRVEELSAPLPGARRSRLIRTIVANLGGHTEAALKGIHGLEGRAGRAEVLRARAEAVVAYHLQILDGHLAAACAGGRAASVASCAGLRTARERSGRILRAIVAPSGAEAARPAADGPRRPSSGRESRDAETARPSGGPPAPLADRPPPRPGDLPAPDLRPPPADAAGDVPGPLVRIPAPGPARP